MSPDAVFALAAGWGSVESTKAEDMRAQQRALRVAAKRPVVFVADTACDLPDPLVVEHGIELVPTQLVLQERVYRDRVELTGPEFFERLRAGYDASTSQPTPDAFEHAYRDALRAGEQVVVVALSGRLSGTHAGALAAAHRLDPEGDRITVVDSRSASLGEGLLVLRGAESDLLLAHTAREMSDRGPKAKVVEFPGVGHAPALMSDAQINVIRNFLEGGAT